MRWIFWSVVFVLSLTYDSFGQGQISYADQVILRELVALRASVDKMATELAALRTENKALKKHATHQDDSRGFTEMKADEDQLDKIHLPASATTEQIEQYIQEIMNATEGQNSFSDTDPQVRMLAEVGSPNINLLIEAMSGPQRGPSTYHLESAIVRIADSQSKDVVLGALASHHGLIRVVAKMRWEKDAREILLDELRGASGYLPTEWIAAVASLKDPASYPLLRDFFINGQNKYWTYEQIKKLPITNMTEAVAEAWDQSNSNDLYSHVNMAIVAVQYGHKDALESLIESLSDDKIAQFGMTGQIRMTILKHADVSGSNTELANWFTKNREKINFDPQSKKYVVADK